MSSCPLIEHVVLDQCKGLKTINFVNNHNFNLNYFKFNSYYMGMCGGKDVNIQICTPSITTIIIDWCYNWYFLHLYYPNLKCLRLYFVRISQESLDGFSSSFPCLEEFVLGCSDLEEFKLSSPSIKRLKIDNMEKLTKAAIDAPKIVLFEYFSEVAVTSFTFATTSNEWKSVVSLYSTVDLNFDASSWFLEISELLTGLSHSEITLDLSPCNGISSYMGDEKEAENRARLEPHINYESGFRNKPVAVENLRLGLFGLYSASSFPHFINALFRVCRPNKMPSHCWYPKHNQVTKSLCKILRMGKDECRDDREMSFWQQDLEGVILEVLLDKNEEGRDGVWHPVQATNWLEYCDALTPKKFLEEEPHELRFQLKWC